MTTALTTPPAAPAPAPDPTEPRRRGRAEFVALTLLLAGTAVLYLWDLAASGWANSYYATAVAAMAQDWTAFFFGSLDAGNVITVDKPPASLWVMALSARVFGFSSWSMLVPQALMGVAAVALLHAAVRRVSAPWAGLVAGAVLALTPVAALMFRFNNPDVLLVLLLVAAAYATVRAIEKAGTRWLLLAGALLGFAFLAKMGQAFLVLPGFALAYLIAAPTGLWRRVGQLLATGVAIVVSAGWWIAVVELWPSDSRPYIGGSQADSVVELALGYNGLGRILGGNGNPGAAAMPSPPDGGTGRFQSLPGGFGGESGWLRMFNESIAGQISWLLPAALGLLIAGMWLTRRSPRTDPVRASLIVWGGWTLVTGIVFSLMSGIFHEYYTVALAPGVAALVAIGGSELWRHRGSWPGRIAFALVIAGTAVWSWARLGRVPDFVPGLRWVVLAASAIAIIVFLLRAARRRATAVAALAVAVTGLAGPTAYTLDTVATPHSGSVVLAGPQTSDRSLMGGPGLISGPGGESRTTDAKLVALLKSSRTKWSAATTGAQSGAQLQLDSGTSVISIGGFSGGDPAPTLEEFQAMVAAGEVRYYIEGNSPGGFPPPGPDSASRAGTGDGGPPGNGGPPGGGGPGGFGGGGHSNSEIADWVAENFTPTTVGGRTVYDLTAG